MATQPSPLTPAESAPAGGPLADLPAWLRPATPVLVMLAMMWTVEIVDVALRGRLDRFGVHPREFSGLTGIVVAPFLHAGFGHLIANTVPFLVLGAIVAYTGLRQFALVTAIVMVGSGAGMWLFGTSNSSWILGALLIGLLYGSLLWGLIPRHGVSFSGHLFGALSGVGAASLLHRSTDDPIDLPR